MGIVCEFYVVKDKIIDEFLAKPSEFEDYFEENYVYVFGKFHKEEENMFYCDKAWDVARYLFQQNSTTLSELLGREIENTEMKSYIKANEVKKINEIISQITLEQILQTYNEIKIVNDYVYNSERFIETKNWEYVSKHVETFYKAFKTAAENNAGIIVSRG
jgi:hypothetical protein